MGFVLKQVGVFVGPVRISSSVNKVEFSVQGQEIAVPHFEGDGWTDYETGMLGAAISFDGYWEADADGATEKALFEGVGVGGAPLVVVKNEEGPALPAARDLCYFCQVAGTSYTDGAKVGDVRRRSLAFKPSGPVSRGKVLEFYAGGSGPATGYGTEVQIPGGVPAGKVLAIAACVTAKAGTLPLLDLVVESDNASGFASPVTRATVPQFSAVGSYYVEIPGPITDDYFRISRTVGGTGAAWGYVVAAAVR